jgi:hypothetical protein
VGPLRVGSKPNPQILDKGEVCDSDGTTSLLHNGLNYGRKIITEPNF